MPPKPLRKDWRKELKQCCEEFKKNDVRRKQKLSPTKHHTYRLNYLHKKINEYIKTPDELETLYYLCTAFDKWRRNDPKEYGGANKNYSAYIQTIRKNLPWPTKIDTKITTACVFACGTGHDHYERKDLLFPVLYNDLLKAQINIWDGKRNENYKPTTRYDKTTKKLYQKAYLIDGIASMHEWQKKGNKKNIVRGATGTDLEGKAKRCVANLIEDDPEKVILIGHSRGAVICLEIAKRLNAEWKKMKIKKNDKKIYLFVIDPVNMATSQGFKDGESLEGYVDELNIMVMANVSKSNTYPLTIPESKSKKFSINLMPGTHGTATQIHKDQAIGMASYYWLLDWMDNLGVVTPKPKPLKKYKELQKDFFKKINEVNPWVIVNHNLGRAIYDYGGKRAYFRPVGNRRKRLSKGKGSHRLSLLQKEDYSLIYHPNYINRHHYKLVKKTSKLPKDKPVSSVTKTILDELDKSLRKPSKIAKVTVKTPDKNQVTQWSPEFRVNLYARILTNK